MRLAPAALAAFTALAGCGSHRPAAPPPVSNTPADGAATVRAPSGALHGADSIELADTWVGLGCTHEFRATLTTDGDAYTGEATLSVGYRQDKSEVRKVSIPRATVAALDAAARAARREVAAAAARDDGQAHTVSTWTDDYPSGGMTFTTGATVQRVFFTEQHRVLQWEHDGTTEPLDTERDIFDEKPSAVWDAYSAVLEAAHLRAWIDELCGR